MKSQRGQFWGAWVIAIGVLLIVFRQLSTAEFTGDDWHYLALLRHIDSPLDIFTTNMGGSYFYRPVGLLFFWIIDALFSGNAAAHYGLNVAIYGWVAFEVGALTLVASNNRSVAMWCAALFLVFPASAATALWISDCFDLIATAAMLCALRCMAVWTLSATTGDRYLYGSIVAACVAIGSKETAFALLPAMLLLLMFSAERRRGFVAAVFIVIGGIALSARAIALGGLQVDQSLAINAASIVSGTIVWASRLPVALATHNGLFALGVLGVGLTISCFNSRVLPPTVRGLSTYRFIFVMAVLLVAVVCSQAPVARGALPVDGNPIPTVSLRFYYTALAIIFIACGAIISRVEWLRWSKRLLFFTALAATVICVMGSVNQTQIWAQETRDEKHAAAVRLRAYASMAEQSQGLRPCLVQLSESSNITDIDLRVKASLNRSDPRVNCALLTTPPQGQTITRVNDCRASSLLPARSAIAGLEPMRRSGTCTFFFLQK